MFDIDEAMRSATLEMIHACKALPDFDTFQIVQIVQIALYLTPTPSPSILDRWLRGHKKSSLSSIVWRPVLKEQSVKDWAMARWKRSETGRQEGEGKKRSTLKVIELSMHGTVERYHLDSLAVEECEV